MDRPFLKQSVRVGFLYWLLLSVQVNAAAPLPTGHPRLQITASQPAPVILQRVMAIRFGRTGECVANTPWYPVFVIGHGRRFIGASSQAITTSYGEARIRHPVGANRNVVSRKWNVVRSCGPYSGVPALA